MSRKIVSGIVLIALLWGILAFSMSPVLEFQVIFASPYTNIDVGTAYGMITGGGYPNLVVLDVRTQGEYDSGHISGATLIPYDQIDSRIGELAGHENHEIIVYCKAGVRSAIASANLDSHGFTKVYNMLGGIDAWKSAGYPVHPPPPPPPPPPPWPPTERIYIRADGSVEGTDKIQQDEDVYIFTGHINGEIVVERDDVIIDGAGHTLQLTGAGSALNLTNRNNVTIENTDINGFSGSVGEYGIWLWHSSNITIYGNNVTGHFVGIEINYSSNSTVLENVIRNNHNGVWLQESSTNSIYGNLITNNNHAMYLNASSNNNMYENSVTDNNYGISLICFSNNNTLCRNNIVHQHIQSNSTGIHLWLSSHNLIYNNNLMHNTEPVRINESDCSNVWDYGYPPGGNYWSNYNGTDNLWGKSQDLTGCDMMGDTPYIINEDNQDNYPLMNPWRESKPPITEFPDLNGDGIVNIVDIAAVAVHFGEEYQDP